MANNSEEIKEETPDVHYIPDNFMNSGRLFNGMIDTRNFIEAIIFCSIIGFLEWLVFKSLGTSDVKMITIMIITIGPFAVLGIIGVNGDSISQFLRLLTNFFKNKRKLRYRRIMKNAKTSGSRAKTRPANSKKKSSRTK